MREPGDIPIVTGRGGGPAPDDVGLVWLVDGQDQPFRDASETARPWLEDSAEWVDGDSSPSDEPKPEDSGGLVWL